MARKYLGIGQVVYGQYKDHIVCTNDQKTYLVIGFGGDKDNDPALEEVLSPDSVSDYRLLSQKEANANSSGVFNATYWFGIGAGLLASQLGKHTEYLVEITFKTGSKSQIVLINEGYQILIGSMTIGSPEIKAAHKSLESANQTRDAIMKDLSYQRDCLVLCLEKIKRVSGSFIAGEISDAINHQIKAIEKEKTIVQGLDNAKLKTYSTLRTGEATHRLEKKAESIVNAYEEYSEQYASGLSELRNLNNKKAILSNTVSGAKSDLGENTKRTAIGCLSVLGVVSAVYAGLCLSLGGKDEAIWTLFFAIGVAAIIGLFYIRSRIKYKKTHSSEDIKHLKEVITEKQALLSKIEEEIAGCQEQVPGFDTWYRSRATTTTK